MGISGATFFILQMSLFYKKVITQGIVTEIVVCVFEKKIL